ncbi:MAG TPA: hypothetical protein VMI35_11095 [Puia sp.]|nr:hypothetical protein [Puia sp.]
MKINSLCKSLACLFVFSSVLFFACKKDNNSSGNNQSGQNNDSTAADLSSSSSSADIAYMDVFQVAIESGADNNIAYLAHALSQGGVETNGAGEVKTVNGPNTCASYTMSPADLTTFPKTVTVDFGGGCTSADGITRKGKITYVFSGKLITPGTTITATFTNYSVYGYTLQGTYSITNMSSPAAGIAFKTQVTGGNITFPNTISYSYAGTKTITQTGGTGTPTNFADDVYSITGGNSISSSVGNTLVDTISTALVKQAACGYISSGIVSFTFNSTLNGTFDYGNGTCDSLATIKVGALTATVSLQ